MVTTSQSGDGMEEACRRLFAQGETDARVDRRAPVVRFVPQTPDHPMFSDESGSCRTLLYAAYLRGFICTARKIAPRGASVPPVMHYLFSYFGIQVSQPATQAEFAAVA